MSIKLREELIKNTGISKPHIVLLGAGASRAAFPSGDVNKKIVPVMNDLINIPGLALILKESGIKIDPHVNFENLYSSIENDDLKKSIEEKIKTYFSQMQLPSTATHYDRILLSLRKKDAIFTFNWDPFLFDAYIRNMDMGISLPAIFFLHGNVRIGSCHSKFGEKNTLCSVCNKKLSEVPLLYPIAKKDYFNSNQYTKSSWEIAKTLFASAFTITIFGYSAPDSDIEAIDLLERAWFENSDRNSEHIEVIDIQDELEIYKRWKRFTPTHHLTKWNRLEDSRLWRWPRRSCESLWYPMRQGMPYKDFPLPIDDSLENLRRFIQAIADKESID